MAALSVQDCGKGYEMRRRREKQFKAPYDAYLRAGSFLNELKVYSQYLTHGECIALKTKALCGHIQGAADDLVGLLNSKEVIISDTRRNFYDF